MKTNTCLKFLIKTLFIWCLEKLTQGVSTNRKKTKQGKIKQKANKTNIWSIQEATGSADL